MLEESLGYLTGVIKNVLHVLLSFFFFFDLLKFSHMQKFPMLQKCIFCTDAAKLEVVLAKNLER